MHRAPKHKKYSRAFSVKTLLVGLALFGITAVSMFPVPQAFAAASSTSGSTFTLGGNNKTQYQCGNGSNTVYTSIDIGCKGASCRSNAPGGCSALTDMAFAIIRALSVGVGIVIVASMIWAGFQYTVSRDDPSAVGKAKDRIRSNIIALLVYIFAYAILNYVIPAGFFG